MQAFERVARARRSRAREPDITEENLQARIRGNLRDGAVEQVRLARADHRQQVGDVGRLRDALRRHGRRLRRAEGRLQGLRSTGWSRGATRRRAGELVPHSVIERPPSAELRYEQRDDQSLPPYDVLDAILEGYVEEDLDAERAGAPRPARGGRRARDPAWSTWPSTSAARRRPASGSRRRRSAATGGCRSRTATDAAERSIDGQRHARHRAALARSFVNSHSQTQLVRPAVDARGVRASPRPPRRAAGSSCGSRSRRRSSRRPAPACRSPPSRGPRRAPRIRRRARSRTADGAGSAPRNGALARSAPISRTSKPSIAVEGLFHRNCIRRLVRHAAASYPSSPDGHFRPARGGPARDHRARPAAGPQLRRRSARCSTAAGPRARAGA